MFPWYKLFTPQLPEFAVPHGFFGGRVQDVWMDKHLGIEVRSTALGPAKHIIIGQAPENIHGYVNRT